MFTLHSLYISSCPVAHLTYLPASLTDYTVSLPTTCSVGSYSESPGLMNVRKDIASYIERRDGFPSNFLHVFLSTGASDGIKVQDVLHFMALVELVENICIFWYFTL